MEQLPRNGSYFTKELAVANTSIIVVRGMDGEVRAFHNICRHRGNKLVWNDFPREETSGTCRQFVCKYHGWRYDLDGACSFVQQESEFFDLDKADYGLVPVHCDVWAGFIFVNLDREPEQTLREFLGPMITALEGYPFDQMTERFYYRADVGQQLEDLHGRVPGVLPRTRSAREAVAGRGAAARCRQRASRRSHYQLDGPHRAGEHAAVRGWEMPPRTLKPMEIRDPQRPVRPVGRARPRRDAAGPQPGSCRTVGPRLVPDLPELRDPDLGAGLVPHVPLLADVAQHARLRGQRLLRAGDATRASGSRTRWRR